MAKPSTKLGRPRKISREDIAQAALEIGLGEATIRKVAAALGVSVMGIYHYVSNAAELQDLAMSVELRMLLPVSEEHDTFEATLFNAAQRYYDVLVAHPQMVLKLVGGHIKPSGTALYLESLLESGVRHKLSPWEAYYAARSVLSCAAGAAAMNVHRTSVDDSRFFDLVADGVTQLGRDRVPHLAELLAAKPLPHPEPLDAVRILLLGLREALGDRMVQPLAPSSDNLELAKSNKRGIVQREPPSTRGRR